MTYCVQAFRSLGNVTVEAYCGNEYSLIETNQRSSVIFQVWLMNTVKLSGFVSLFAGVRVCTTKGSTYSTPAMKVTVEIAWLEWYRYVF